MSSKTTLGPRWRHVVVLLLACCCSVTHAADDKKSDREARRAQLLEQRLEQEKAAWATEKADLEKQLADAQAAAAGLKQQSDKVSEDLKKTSGERGALQKDVLELKKQLADAKRADEQRAAADSDTAARFAKAREQERVTLNSRYSEQSAALAACTDKNERLLQVSHELLQRYRDKDVIDALRQADPVLGFKDVDTFNQVQDFRDKVDAERFTPAEPAKP